MLVQNTCTPTSATSTDPRGPSAHRLRALLTRAFDKLHHGHLTLRDHGAEFEFGDPAAGAIRATVDVVDPRFYHRVLLGGTVAAGESYASGDWQCDDLTQLVRILLANRDVLDTMDSGLLRGVRKIANRIGHHLRANTRAGSRVNIAAHYDLSNDFFKLWLDEHMMYSSALFATPDQSLDEASTNKLRRICELLQLQPGEHLLEIGTGWGGLAAFAATHHNVQVTTTTISNAQYRAARERIRAAGLESQVTVLEDDYRDLQGRFDKIVSVEMVEAVGHEFLDGYFARVESLLKPGGRFVMQAITIQDQRYDEALREVDFIKKHIFPGSFLPSVTRLTQAAARTSGLRLTALDDIGPHYARTLSAWADNFTAHSNTLRQMGFDETFQRLWHFYLAYCEAAFTEGAISDVHAVFSAPRAPLEGPAT